MRRTIRLAVLFGLVWALMALPASAASAATVVAGHSPRAVAVNSVTNNIYVANANSNNVTVIDGATNSATTVAVGAYPLAVAVNPATNKIYVANLNSDNVTVIDGATNSATTVATGRCPCAVAVNPATNKVYVATLGSASVTVIDGATNAATTVAAGVYPYAVAVNPATDKIYVANRYSASVTVIDGATNSTSSVPAGRCPCAVAVNPATNRVYVANEDSNNVTVIDGATNSATTVAVGSGPIAVSVNPVTNKIYVANANGNNVTVIDGATNSATTVATRAYPRAVAVNPTTNEIYVAHWSIVTVIDGATNSATTVAAGTVSFAVAVNPATNKIYVANYGSNDVTVIDGATNSATTVAVGTGPCAVAGNPATNKIYVANYWSNNVTVIDGATNSATTVAAGTNPFAVAVNPATNKIYVANLSSGNVTVIDGATNSATTVAVGTIPNAVAVNPATNKIYVANAGSDNVTVIDGATNSTSTVAAGADPHAVAVNPTTNKIYVANAVSDDVTVIDGATNSTSTVAAGAGPAAVAVNPVTNKVYVANVGSNNVTVIDGATNSATTVAAGTIPSAIAVNPVTNKVYVANCLSNSVTVIDGATNSVSTIAAGTIPSAVAVNPVTNKIYATDEGSNNVTVIDEQAEQDVPLTVAIAPLPGDRSTRATPVFSLTATSTFAPTAPELTGVYCQVDTFGGPWLKAQASGGGYAFTTPQLEPGTHVLYAFATDGQCGDSVNTGNQSSPLIGSVSAYVFLVPKTYALSPSAGANGSISPATAQTVEWGSAATFTITPDAGYHIADVLVDGASVGAVGSYTFTNVTANHTIAASFTINRYTLTPSAGANGSISPATAQTVDHGTNATFTMTPDAGYHVADVLVDGASVGAVNSYSFTNVTANHTLAATFATSTVAPGDKTILRVSGADRYGTAVAMAREGWDPAGTKTWPGVKYVVVASGEDRAIPDLLSAAGLCGVYDAPLLVVPGNGTLPASVRIAIAEIASCNNPITVLILGGKTAVHRATASAIDRIAGVNTPVRIAGSDRYSTSAAIARRIVEVKGAGAINGCLFICAQNPAAFDDALAAGAIAYRNSMPMLAVKTGSVPTPIRSVISSYFASTPKFSVSAADYLGASASGTTRIVTSTDRYVAATQIANAAKARGWLAPTDVGIAAKLPDALGGGAFLGRKGGVLLYTTSTASMQVTTRNWITANKALIYHGWAIGGTTAVPAEQMTQFYDLIR